MEPTETDSVVLHASRRWWNKVDLRRGETPWLTFASKSSAFSLNGKDYTIKRRGIRGPVEFSHAGETIVEVKGLAFDYAGKKWAMKGTGIFSSRVNLDCDGRVVGEFKRPGGFYFGTKVDIRLPRELPDEIQVLLIWFYINVFVVDAAST
jgi:hypothetical protein